MIKVIKIIIYLYKIIKVLLNLIVVEAYHKSAFKRKNSNKVEYNSHLNSFSNDRSSEYLYLWQGMQFFASPRVLNYVYWSRGWSVRLRKDLEARAHGRLLFPPAETLPQEILLSLIPTESPQSKKVTNKITIRNRVHIRSQEASGAIPSKPCIIHGFSCNTTPWWLICGEEGCSTARELEASWKLENVSPAQLQHWSFCAGYEVEAIWAKFLTHTHTPTLTHI
jgi:hypothetical protein